MLKHHTQNGILYVALQTLLCIVLATLWGYIGIKYYTQTGFLAIANGWLCGMLCALFMRKRNKRYFMLAALVAAFLSVHLGIYIDFAYIEKNLLIEESIRFPFWTAFRSLEAISITRYASFTEYLSDEGSYKVFFWHILVLASCIYPLQQTAKIKSRFFKFKKFLLSFKNTA